MLPRFGPHLKRINSQHTAHDMAAALRFAKDQAVARRTNIEMVLYASSQNALLYPIAGFQIGQNLQSDGSSVSGTEILEDYPIEKRLSVSPNANVRKIVFQPVGSILVYDKTNTALTSQNATIYWRVDGVPVVSLTVFYETGEVLVQ